MSRHFLLLALLGLSVGGCQPGPVSPSVVEAGDASPCQVDQAITQDRVIRTESGAPLVLPGCPDSGVNPGSLGGNQ